MSERKEKKSLSVKDLDDDQLPPDDIQVGRQRLRGGKKPVKKAPREGQRYRGTWKQE